MRMQEICKISGFTKRNIHYYIKEGLLSPASDAQNGYYDFSEGEVLKGFSLWFYRKMHFLSASRI